MKRLNWKHYRNATFVYIWTFYYKDITFFALRPLHNMAPGAAGYPWPK